MKMDSQFSLFSTSIPNDKQSFQVAATETGARCQVLARPTHLGHKASGDARYNRVKGMGVMGHEYMKHNPSEAMGRFDRPVGEPKESNWGPSSLNMLGKDTSPLPPMPAAGPFHTSPQTQFNNPSYFYGAPVSDAAGDSLLKLGSDTDVSQAILDVARPRLFPSQNVTQPSAEQHQDTRPEGAYGIGRPQHLLPASQRVTFDQRAVRHSHGPSFARRASDSSQGDSRLSNLGTLQFATTGNQGIERLQDFDTSSTFEGTSSSPAAEAALRKQPKTQHPYSTSTFPDVTVSHIPSTSLPGYSGLTPASTYPHASSSSSVSHVSLPKVAFSQRLALPQAPPLANGIILVNPKDRIPDRFRSVFPYELFNAMQSKCFDSVYMTDDNVVVSAPTGSGKTVLFELAICKLVNREGNENAKIVYIAPTKALCKEKAEQWHKKFGMISMPVSELTGDTSRAEMRSVRESKIIVTTPEKWDSITRSWIDHKKLLDLVELFLIDEVHILKESRGATLEAVVSRMKTYGSKVRFIALSATVPNSADIASWLGRDHATPRIPAQREVFGEEFRPVKLQKIVHGIEAKLADHPFDNYLNSQLWKYIEMHTQKKPMLVFCMTRKSCRNAAEELAKQWSQRQPSARLWPPPRKRIPVIDVELQELVRCGVAFHHAGLEPDDRKAIHEAFEEGHLSVICCTSTLAVGVNLPCHTVVLKGTVSYQDGGQLCEYSDLEVMQMLGRAGRPQFEDSALAIVLTRSCNKKRYEELGSGQQILESTLHKNLIEHLNSEISLGSFQNTKGAKLWLKGTFLSVRLHQNPQYYSDLADGESNLGTRGSETIEYRLEHICEAAIDDLRDVRLITGDTTFQHTDYGRAMSKYMIRFETMKMILKIPRGATIQVLLSALCEAREFNNIRWQSNERDLFREINRDPFIMYPIQGTLSSLAHKVSLLIQMELGRVEVTNINGFERQRLRAETSRVLDLMHRLIRTVIECKGSDADGRACWAALNLARSMTAKAWEGRPMQLLQVPQLGPVLMRKLVSHNIRSVSQLVDSEPGNIERIASRNPPFGKKLVDSLAFFPRLTLDTAIKDNKVDLEGNPVICIDAFLGFLNARGKWQSKMPIVTFLAMTTEGISIYFCRESLNAFDHDSNTRQIHFTWTPNSAQETLICHFACEDIVGTTVSTKMHHNLPASAFPPQIENGQLPSVEPQKPVPRQISTASLSFENEVEDDDMLAMLEKVNGFTHDRSADLRDEIDADVDDDDLLASLDHKGNDEKIPQASESIIDQAYQDLGTSMPSSCAVPQNAGLNTKQTPRPRNSQNHKHSFQASAGSIVKEEPTRLPNGRFKCGHACSQIGGGRTARGDKCGHECCRIGSKHPPKKQYDSGKRKENSCDEVKPVSQSVPEFVSSNRPAKRAKTKRAPNGKAEVPAPISLPSPSRSQLSRDDFDLDLGLRDVDEEGIIDLTGDHDELLKVPRRTRTHSVLHLSGMDAKENIYSIKKAIPADDMVDSLFDDDFADIAVALEATSRDKLASLPNGNDNSIDYSDEITSLMLLNKAQEDGECEAQGEQSQMANDKPSGDQEHVCDVTRPGKHGNMRCSHMPDESMLAEVFPLLSPGIEMISNGLSAYDEEISPAGVLTARSKSPHTIATIPSTDKDNAITADLQSGPSILDGTKATQSKKEIVPEWVNEFDPTFISEFRGLVDFI